MNMLNSFDGQGNWKLYVDDLDGDAGLQMLGTATLDGVTGALGFHELMRKYWFGTRVGTRTHWRSLPADTVIEAGSPARQSSARCVPLIQGMLRQEDGRCSSRPG